MRPGPLALTLIGSCGGSVPLSRASRRLSQMSRCHRRNAPPCLVSSAAKRRRSRRFALRCRSAVYRIIPIDPATATCSIFWRAWRPGADRLRRHSQVPPECRCEFWGASSTNRKLPHLTRLRRSAPLAPSEDANFSGGLLGRLTALAGLDPQNPGQPAPPPQDDQLRGFYRDDRVQPWFARLQR